MDNQRRKFEKYVTNLTINTKENNLLKQSLFVPCVHDLKAERSHKVNYELMSVNFLRDAISFLVENLPIRYPYSNNNFKGTLTELIDKGYIAPILLFYNGKYINSDNVFITVNRYSVITIRGVKEVKGKMIQCIKLPLSGKVSIIRNVDLLYLKRNIFEEGLVPIFIFSDDGLCITTRDILPDHRYTIIAYKYNRIDESLLVEQFKVLSNKIYKSDIIPDRKYMDNNNIIYFKNGLLPDNAIEKNQLEFRGYNKFRIKDKFDDVPYQVKVFMFDDNEVSKGIINNINIANTEYEIDNDFSFKFDIKKSRTENINNLITHIMKYDSGMLKRFFLENNQVKTIVYSGKHLKSLNDINGNITMSTRLDKENFNKVMIFKNGNLYNKYYSIQYIDNDFMFYLDEDDTKDDDVFEIIYFKKCYNISKQLTLNSAGDDQYYIGEDIDLNDCTFYSIDLIDENKINYNDTTDGLRITSEFAKFDVPVKTELLDTNIYEIIPDNPYYYDRPLNLVSNRQFHYTRFINRKSNTKKIPLPVKFSTCKDIEKFMIFINGIKLNRSNYGITIVTRKTPYNKANIHFNIALKKNDIIEVFYLPEKMKEIYNSDKLNDKSGSIILDKNILSYNLDKELDMVFINGKKINKDNIVNMSQNSIKIKNSDSIYNVCIINHLNVNDKQITDLFKSNNDIITKLVNSIDKQSLDENLNKLFGNSNIQTSDDDKPFDFDKLSTKQVIIDIVKDYWDNPYQYDDENQIDLNIDIENKNDFEKDVDGNIVLPV